MEIVFKNTKSKYLEIFSLINLDNIHETFKRFSSTKEPLEAKIFAVNESISSHQLAKLKPILTKSIFVPYAFTQIIDIRS